MNRNIINSELDRIGNFPILHLNPSLEDGDDLADIYVALLHHSPTGSHKVFSYKSMIEAEEEQGNADESTIFVDYTTGNAGIAGAFICAQKGYDFSVFMPENMSDERIEILKALGADLHLTPENEFIVGCKERAEEFIEEEPENRILLNQSENLNNRRGYHPVGEKIYNQIEDIDVFVSGSGTYGTITGISQVLKEKDKNIKVVLGEAEYAPHIDAKRNDYDYEFEPHNLIGFGAELLAPNAKPELYDETRTIDQETAEEAMKEMHSKGYLIGKTSGANIHWAIEEAKKLGDNGTVVTNTWDSFNRILSEKLYE
ncbi:MAG: PLP-dependent cysteine synthase family protein [Candidatus Magasanikbacteria bacterium]